MKKKYLIVGLLFLVACNGRLDEMRPHNMAEAESYLSSFNNIVNATSGLYGQFLRQAVIRRGIIIMVLITCWASSGGIMSFLPRLFPLKMVLCLQRIICEPRMPIFS